MKPRAIRRALERAKRRMAHAMTRLGDCPRGANNARLTRWTIRQAAARERLGQLPPSATPWQLAPKEVIAAMRGLAQHNTTWGKRVARSERRLARYQALRDARLSRPASRSNA